MKYCLGYERQIAALCAKFHNGCTTRHTVVDEKYLTKCDRFGAGFLYCNGSAPVSVNGIIISYAYTIMQLAMVITLKGGHWHKWIMITIYLRSSWPFGSIHNWPSLPGCATGPRQCKSQRYMLDMESSVFVNLWRSLRHCIYIAQPVTVKLQEIPSMSILTTTSGPVHLISQITTDKISPRDRWREDLWTGRVYETSISLPSMNALAPVQHVLLTHCLQDIRICFSAVCYLILSYYLSSATT